jgi:glutaconate CoA-transferase subunit B
MKKYSLEELLVCEISRRLIDDKMYFTGIGTGGKAYIRACGIPLVAVRLAQVKHAPNAMCMMGPVLDPLLDADSVPDSNWEYDLINWPCRSQIPLEDALGQFKLGKIDMAFASAAQVDQYGNLNIACIGDYKKPEVRLPGVLAQTDLTAFADRVCIVINHEKRVLVEHVDFISGTGNENRVGLPGGGTAYVMTNLAIMDFDHASGKMKVYSIHPGVTVDRIRENTGFDILIPDDVITTPEPTEEDLHLIREIDPRKKFLNAMITQDPATLEDEWPDKHETAMCPDG